MGKVKQRVSEGFAAALGKTSKGWYAGVLVRPDRDKGFVEDLGEKASMMGAKLRPGQTDAAWGRGALPPDYRSRQKDAHSLLGIRFPGRLEA